MKARFCGTLGLFVGLTLLVAACTQPAPAAPTKAPEQPKPTAAAAPAATKASEATKAPEATKPVAAPTGAAATKSQYPTGPITVIIPWPAGGAADVGARLLFSLVEKDLGQPIKIVCKEGAGSQVGLTEIANAKPDGYTIGMASLPTAQAIYLDPERKATFSLKSYVPLALHASDPGAIGVAKDSKYKTLKDLIDDAKANPEKVKVAVSGVLNDDHLAILALQRVAGVKFGVVTFDGGAPARTALLGGHVDAICENVGVLTPIVKPGQARILGVMDKSRSKFYPDIPTFKEQGVDLNSSVDRAYMFPAGISKDVVGIMERAIEKAMKDPDHIKKMEDQGVEVRFMNSEQLTTYWKEVENLVAEVLKTVR